MRIVTFKDVNVEEVQKTDIDIPDSMCSAALPENESSAEAVGLVFLLWRLLSDLAVILCACAQVHYAFPYLQVEYLDFVCKETSK